MALVRLKNSTSNIGGTEEAAVLSSCAAAGRAQDR